MKNFNKVVWKYLQANGIKTRFFADYIGCEYSRCARWFSGERKLSPEQMQKAIEFITGRFLTPVDEIE